MAQHEQANPRLLDIQSANIAALDAELQTAFLTHPDAAITSSFPGLGTVLGARLLGEIDIDPTVSPTTARLNTFAGTAPVTHASGRKTVVRRRVIRSKPFGQVAYLWALPMEPRSRVLAAGGWDSLVGDGHSRARSRWQTDSSSARRAAGSRQLLRVSTVHLYGGRVARRYREVEGWPPNTDAGRRSIKDASGRG